MDTSRYKEIFISANGIMMSVRGKSLPFAEFIVDEMTQGREGGVRIRAVGFDMDAASRRRGKHHEPHDRRAAHSLIVAGDNDIHVEALDAFDKFCGSAGMQAPFIADF